MAPPTAPTSRRGKVSKNATTPIANGDLETYQTSQLCAIVCMKSPELEISARAISRRKCRGLRERRVRRFRGLGVFQLPSGCCFFSYATSLEFKTPQREHGA